MIKIHGTSISNYYSTAKCALVEKGIKFEEVSVFPSREPAVLASSPMGKVPWIEVDGKVLSEVNAIFDYLEDIHPTPPLYPTDAWARAKTKEIIRIIELYLDAQARRHIAAVYFGGDVDPVAFEQVRPALENGLLALSNVAKYGPYIAGDQFTYADIVAYFQIGFTNMHTQKIYDWDIVAADPALKDYIAMLNERPGIAAVAGVMRSDMAKFAAR